MGQPLKILIVEDDTDLCAVVSAVLRDGGHEVAMAHDGESALQQARATSPDAVLLDIGLPDFIGYDIARALRQKRILAETAIIVVVTGDSDASVDRANAVGVDVLLRKPVSPAALADLVDFLHQRRQNACKSSGNGEP